MSIGIGPSMTRVKRFAEYTWSGKPAAATAGAGAVIRVTDVGVGPGSLWMSDGAIWTPIGGSITILSLGGEPAAPVATLSANGTFSLPAGNPVIPAGVLRASAFIKSEIYVRNVYVDDANATWFKIKVANKTVCDITTSGAATKVSNGHASVVCVDGNKVWGRLWRPPNGGEYTTEESVGSLDFSADNTVTIVSEGNASTQNVRELLYARLTIHF